MSEQLVTNTNELVQRLGLAAQLGQSFGGKRDYYATLGYKNILLYDDYQAAYDRQDIATRIIDAPVNELWRNFPSIEEKNDQQDWSPFELAWQELSDRLSIPQYVQIVDKVAGIGQFALLLLGATDSPDFSQPLEHVTSDDSIQYLSVFNQRQVMFNQFDLDPTSPRFGKPTYYQVDLSAGHSPLLLASLPNRGSVVVHYSRVIHVAENTMGDGIIGTPRLQKVMNRLEDLTKVVGGSAEVFWLAAWQGMVAEMDKDARMSASNEQVEEEFEKYIHGLQRYLRVKGMKVYSLGGETPHPREAFDIIVECISSATSIPQRILMGSERGSLASTQDENNWKDYISQREQYGWSAILRPLVERLVSINALPTPQAQVEAIWPNRFGLTPQEQADVNLKKAQTLKTYSSTPELVVPPRVFVEEFLGLPPEIVDQAEQESQVTPLNEQDQNVADAFAAAQPPEATMPGQQKAA